MYFQHKFLYLLIILGLNVPYLAAQETLESNAHSIIQKYVEAIGGKNNLKTIKTLILKGKGKNGRLEMELPMNIYIKNPNKTRTEVEIMRQYMVSASDGEVVWELNPFLGKGQARELPLKMETQELKNSVFFTLSKYLINYKEKGFKAKYLGKANFKGKKTHRIQLTSEYGLFDYYLDIRTYYLLMAKVNLEKHYFDDYRKVDNITMPHFLENKKTGFQMSVEEVILNENIDDNKFKMPYTQFNASENILLNKKITAEIFDFSEEALTGEDIIKRFLQVSNYDTYVSTNLKSSTIVGSMTMGSIDLPFTLYTKAYTKYRMEIDAMGQKGVLASNGKQYWEINPFEKNAKPKHAPYYGKINYENYSSDEGVLPYRNDLLFTFADELIPNRNGEYPSTEYLGKVDVRGRTSHVVKIDSGNYKEVLCFFDVENYYLLMKYYKYDKTQEFYGNYQKVDSFYLPFDIGITNILGTKNNTIKYKKITFGEKFSNKHFDFPKKD